MRCGVCGQRYGDYIIPHGQTDCVDDRMAPTINDIKRMIEESESEDESE